MTDCAHRPDGSETERAHQAVAVAFPRQLARNSARELFVVLCGMALANYVFIYHVLVLYVIIINKKHFTIICYFFLYL